MSSVICGSERRPLVARMLGGNASTKTTTSQSLPEFKIFLLARSPMCACGGHVDPHLLVNYLPLLFRLCIQMGLSLSLSLSLEDPSPTSSSFCTCEESYSRKTPPPPTTIPSRPTSAETRSQKSRNSADVRRKSPTQRLSTEVMRCAASQCTLGGLRKAFCGVTDGL